MKTLYLIRGASGSGKSTLAYQLLDGFISSKIAAEEFCADDYFYDGAGKYNFDPAKLREAHKWCREQCEDAMKHDVPNVIIHNTFTRQWECAVYHILAQSRGYTVFEIICNNKFQNVHNVPEHIVSKQRERFEY